MTTADDIKDQLKSLGLDTRGNKSTLKARLRKHLKKTFPDRSGPSFAAQGQDFEDDLEQTSAPNSVNTEAKEKGNDLDAVVAAIEAEGQQPLHKNSRYDYYLCFDVEATCESGYSFEFPNEVIEFPVVMLDGSTLEVVDEFHSYVRPTNRPVLSDFCKELTGIQQGTIDEAPTFVEVLQLFQDWLIQHEIIIGEYVVTGGGGKRTPLDDSPKKIHGKKKKGKSSPSSSLSTPFDFQYGATFCFVTDGPFDIRDFISKQCLHSGIRTPSYFTQSYIDIRTLFRDYFDLSRWLNLAGMLAFMGESFEGRQHSGICDARMVGLIAKRLALGFVEELPNRDAVFNEENLELLATKWSFEKMQKFKTGVTLKANRSTSKTNKVKMISFETLLKLEGKQSRLRGASKKRHSAVSASVCSKDVEHGIEAEETKDETKEALPLSKDIDDEEGAEVDQDQISEPSTSPALSLDTESTESAVEFEPESEP